MKTTGLLLVEDDPNDEELIRLSLEEHKISVEIFLARDGLKALDYIQQDIKLPGLILLDLKLPKVNGLELLKEIRKLDATRHIPVVVFSSSKEEQDIIESYRLGANAYVRKPIDSDEFSLTVKDIANFWLMRNEII